MTEERLEQLARAYDSFEAIKVDQSDVRMLAFMVKQLREDLETQRELTRLSNELVLGLSAQIREDKHAKETPTG